MAAYAPLLPTYLNHSGLWWIEEPSTTITDINEVRVCVEMLGGGISLVWTSKHEL